jgi:hypothetical protein
MKGCLHDKKTTAKGASTVTSHEEIFGNRTESGEVDLVAFMCEQFQACDCIQALETCSVALQTDIKDKATYTLVDGALDKMRAAYKKRLDELKGK